MRKPKGDGEKNPSAWMDHGRGGKSYTPKMVKDLAFFCVCISLSQWANLQTFGDYVLCNRKNEHSKLLGRPIPSMYDIFIFTYIWLISMANVGTYTSPMDSMGMVRNGYSEV